MSTLQEVLAVLLGAEWEAKMVVEESEHECQSYLRSVQDKSAAQRESEIESAREQAKSIIGNATDAAKAEAEQIMAIGRDERGRMQKNYNDNIEALIDAMTAEIAENLISQGRVKA